MKRHRGNKYILLSESSQSEDATYYKIPTILHSRKGKTMKTIKKISGWGRVVRQITEDF